MYFDAHCHLDTLSNKKQLSDYISSFAEKGGSWLICIGTDLQDSQYNHQIYENSKLICKKNNVSLGYTMGIHPGMIAELDDTSLVWLEWQIILYQKKRKNNDILPSWLVGIWEIWTDLHYEIWSDVYDKQIYFFDAQCQLGTKYNLPIVVHSRDDFQWTLGVVKKYPTHKFYFHCRWYSTKEIAILSEVLGDNLWIWFCWNISYPKAKALKDSFRYAWENNVQVLLETDSPYLSIQSLRWTPNSSSNIWLHYDYISDYFDINKDDLIQKIRQNYTWFYSWL